MIVYGSTHVYEIEKFNSTKIINTIYSIFDDIIINSYNMNIFMVNCWARSLFLKSFRGVRRRRRSWTVWKSQTLRSITTSRVENILNSYRQVRTYLYNCIRRDNILLCTHRVANIIYKWTISIKSLFIEKYNLCLFISPWYTEVRMLGMTWRKQKPEKTFVMYEGSLKFARYYYIMT